MCPIRGVEKNLVSKMLDDVDCQPDGVSRNRQAALQWPQRFGPNAEHDRWPSIRSEGCPHLAGQRDLDDNYEFQEGKSLIPAVANKPLLIARQ